MKHVAGVWFLAKGGFLKKEAPLYCYDARKK